jgi:integrase
MYFWSGIGKLKTALTDWPERLQKVAKIAGIEGRGVAHRLRDTFSVSLLNGGVPIEAVAVCSGIRLRLSRSTIRRGSNRGKRLLRRR